VAQKEGEKEREREQKKKENERSERERHGRGTAKKKNNKASRSRYPSNPCKLKKRSKNSIQNLQMLSRLWGRKGRGGITN
jgi:hypothetical protein